MSEEAWNPRNTLLGKQQRGWLDRQLLQSTSTWNVLAQQVMFAMVERAAKDVVGYSMDQWPGAAFERLALMRFIADRKIPNPIVITGDIHSNWVNDLRIDDRNIDQPVVATEFVGTSISSGGNGPLEVKDLDSLLAANPFTKFHNRERGYVRCVVTPEQWTSDYIVVEDVESSGGEAKLRASFIVEQGHPGAQAL